MTDDASNNPPAPSAAAPGAPAPAANAGAGGSSSEPSRIQLPPGTVVDPGKQPVRLGKTDPHAAKAGPRIWPWVLLALLIGGGWWLYHHHQQAKQGQGQGGPGGPGGPGGGGAGGGRRGGRGGRGGGGGPGMSTPVLVAPVVVRPMTAYAEALGTVTPNQIAIARPRATGVLTRVLFHEGQVVQAGQLLAETDTTPLALTLIQSQGQLARDAALLANARRDLGRYQRLLAENAISDQIAATQAATVRQYEGVIEADRAAVAAAKLQVSFTRIVAPIGGRVGLLQVALGTQIGPTDATGVTTIAQLNPIAILFSLPAEAARTVLGVMAAAPASQPLPVQALAEDRTTLLSTGRLLTADNAIDTTTGSLRFKALFENPGQALYPNQFVNVRVRLKTDPQALAVPSQAIQQGATGSFVYVVGPNNIPALKNVTPGVVDGGFTAISGDLKPGEQVITDGTDKVKPGEKVRIGKPAPQVAARVTSGQGRGHGRHRGQGNDGSDGGQGQGQGPDGQGQGQGQGPDQAAAPPGQPGARGPQGQPAPPGGAPPVGDAPNRGPAPPMAQPAVATPRGAPPAAASTGLNASPHAADDAATAGDQNAAQGQNQGPYRRHRRGNGGSGGDGAAPAPAPGAQ